jgi:hypothetical protein
MSRWGGAFLPSGAYGEAVLPRKSWTLGSSDLGKKKKKQVETQVRPPLQATLRVVGVTSELCMCCIGIGPGWSPETHLKVAFPTLFPAPPPDIQIFWTPQPWLSWGSWVPLWRLIARFKLSLPFMGCWDSHPTSQSSSINWALSPWDTVRTLVDEVAGWKCQYWPYTKHLLAQPNMGTQ